MIKPLLLLAGLALAAPAMAQSATPRIDARSDARLASDLARTERQSTRIDNGVESGRLNETEAARLDRRTARTERTTERLAADGRYSRADAARVDRQQDKTSRQIARGKANRR